MRFGENRVTLPAWAEKEGKIVIEVTAQKGFTLKVLNGEIQKIFYVSPGTHRFPLPGKDKDLPS
ncbi:hypothetical protein ES703_46877 [subsurface metagenome]